MDHETHDVDAAHLLRTIDADRERTQASLAPDVRLLYSVWGVAWIIGFTAAFLGSYPWGAPILPLWIALVIAGAALVAAIVISAVHSARRGSGMRGPSNVRGAITGNAFPLAFLVLGALGFRLAVAGTPPDAMLAYWVVGVCLVIGALGVVGAAMWNDRGQLAFSAWVLVVGFVAAWIPGAFVLLAGAVGGLGFLALGILAAARPRLVTGPIAPRHG